MEKAIAFSKALSQINKLVFPKYFRCHNVHLSENSFTGPFHLPPRSTEPFTHSTMTIYGLTCGCVCAIAKLRDSDNDSKRSARHDCGNGEGVAPTVQMVEG